MDRPRLYLAGPMRGIPLFNFPAFDEAARAFASRFEVINPANLDRAKGFDPTTLPEGYAWQNLEAIGFDLREAVRRDVDAILSCDAIFMLEGWERSTGARAEHALAVWLGLDILYQ